MISYLKIAVFRVFELSSRVFDNHICQQMKTLFYSAQATEYCFSHYVSFCQILVREYGGLTKIPELLEVTSLDVRIQALNVINNLAMDAENQAVLRVRKLSSSTSL